MPRVVEPSIRKAGPLGMKASKERRLKTKDKTSRSRSMPPVASFGKAPEEPLENEQKISFIGEELLEWNSENADVVPKAIWKSIAHRPNAAEYTPADSDIFKYSPNCSAPDVDRDQDLARQTCSSLSRHALAIDTRYLEKSNNASDHTTAYYKDFIRTLARRGAAPCLVATTIATVPNTLLSTGLVALGIDVKAYSLGDKATLQTVTESERFVSQVSIYAKETTGALLIPKAMTAEISWMLFGQMGTKRRRTNLSCVSLCIFVFTHTPFF
jgi:hypothetical protein